MQLVARVIMEMVMAASAMVDCHHGDIMFGAVCQQHSTVSMIAME